MSISREVTVWCDGCSVWEQAPSPVRLLREDLRKRGWRRVNGKDYCRSCAEKELKTKEQNGK